MRVIYFIRHGESEANAADIVAGDSESPLTEAGREQARMAGEQCSAQALHFDSIVSSPLGRTLETARYIAEAIGYPVAEIQTWDDLRERHRGDFEGGPQSAYRNTPESESAKHGAETVETLYERAQRVKTHLDNYPDKSILLVSHNAIGKMLRAVYAGEPITAYRKSDAITNAQLLRFDA